MKIKRVRSTIGKTPNQRKNLEALGLRKVNQVKDVQDNAVTWGMINKVKHMVEVIWS
jgi:large subunit ribosomal protein L30